MFDISARPYIPKNMLTFAVPISKFVKMVDNMEESFFVINAWRMVQKRID